MNRAAHLVTGPTHSGKTGRLLAWARTRTDVVGIAAPDGPNGRRMLDLRSGESVEMEKPEEGEPSVSVGPYRFRRAAFDWAGERLIAAAADPTARFLVIDEVGPLELRGDGLATVLREVVASSRPELVLLVREGLTTQVETCFSLAFTLGEPPPT